MPLIKNICPLYFNNYILKGCMRSVFYSPSDTDSLCRLINKFLEIGKKDLNNKEDNVIFDLGCGSCIPTIFLAEKLREKPSKFKVNAFDIDEDAINISERNVKKMNMDYINIEKKDIFSFLTEEVNKNITLIISNPPYIPIPKNTTSKSLICIDGGEFGTKYTVNIIRYPKVKYIALQTGSISNPAEVLNEIFRNGFDIKHVNIIETKFGIYTRKDYIRKHLKKLKENKKSYFHNGKYLILGFILEKSGQNTKEKPIKEEFIKFLESYSENGLKNACTPKVPFKMEFMRYKNTL